MAARRHCLVIDIGKTNAKALVFDESLSIIDERSTQLRGQAGPPFAHLPINRLLGFIDDAVAAATRRFPDLCIVPVTHGAAIALADDQGLVLPILDYESEAPESARDYGAVRPPFEETLSPALPAGLNLGRQLFWLARTFPDAFARAQHFLTLPQFLGWHLANVRVSEVTSLGCHSDLWNPDAQDFSSLVDAEEWRARFPPLRLAGAPLGPLSPSFGPQGNRPLVLNGLHDSNASLVRYLDSGEPVTVLSTGTWYVAMVPGAAIDGLDRHRDCLANVDVRSRPYPCARFMGGREYALLAGDAAPDDEPLAAIARAIDRQAFVLPNHSQSGGPFPGAVGTVDADLDAIGSRMVWATLYVALMSWATIELVSRTGPVVIEGPAASNPLFCALLQALMPTRFVCAGDDPHATARGAATLAFGMAASARPALPARCAAAPLDGLDGYAEAWRQRAVAAMRR